MDKETRAHNRVLAEYQRRMQDILDRYSRDISRLAGAVQADPDRPFAFSDYPPLKDRHAAMLAEMRSLMVSQVEDAVRQEWGRADRKNDALAVSVIGSEEGAAALGYIRRNTDALEAFMTRKTAGMDLSGRVWDITGQFDTQVQDAIDTALLDGKSADELSREVRNLLHNPDALFRRVRDNRGLLHLSRNAKAYHPGQGVYRSAYMNARRMAATEINMAYRTADHLRVQQMDFVVGIEVHLSGNHNCKGVPPGQFVDICDELQGRYPKDFKFTGWHPFCRCYATTVLKTRQEMKEDAARIRNGEKPSEGSVNSVDTFPEGFTKWVDRNQQRIATARTLPYFLRDNGQINANGAWEPFNQIAADTKPTLLEIAAKRHAERTDEQIKAIKEKWQKRSDAYGALDILSLAFDDDKQFGKIASVVGDITKARNEIGAFMLQKITDYTFEGISSPKLIRRIEEFKSHMFAGQMENAAKSLMQVKIEYVAAKAAAKAAAESATKSFTHKLAAKSVKEAEEEIAKATGLNVNFTGFTKKDLVQINEIYDAISDHIEKVPGLKKQLRFIGSTQGQYGFLIEDEFNRLKSILPGFSDHSLRKNAKDKANKYLRSSNIETAWSWISRTNPEVSGIAWNSMSKFRGEEYIELARNLVKSRWHPEGTATVKGSVVHELGHQIDNYLNLKNNTEFLKIYSKYAGNDTLTELSLSRYATTNKEEFIAEAWSEYLCNPTPRDVAKEIGELIEKLIGVKFRK